MSDWTDGYVSEIDYTFGYYSELNPSRIAVPFFNVGLAPPQIATACELGFGQGVSVNIHAAASDIEWWGTDFNPSHAAFAQSLAEAAGSKAHLFDQSFAEFCTRPDLPDFDYIGLHGVWSWVSQDNQRIIVDFIRKKLKVGGVLYISYNTQPGHAAMVPLRHLLTEHAGMMAAPGIGIVARIDAALDFAEKLLALNPAFAIANPVIPQRLQVIKEHNRNYLAHEYFNRDWTAMLFAELAHSLAPAKLSYACSAHYYDHIDTLNLTEAQLGFLTQIPDPLLRQSARDFIVNQQFRRDYWVKGARRLSPLEQREALRQLRVLLVTGPADPAPFTVQGALGPREISPAVYQPITDALGARQIKSIGEIEAALDGKGVPLAVIYEAVMLLAGKGDLVIVQDEAVQERARGTAERLNRRILDKARSGNELTMLASPVTGGGILVGRTHQLFLLARAQGRKTQKALAQFAWDLLGSQNQRLVKDGKPLETPEENLAQLGRDASQFLAQGQGAFRALQLL